MKAIKSLAVAALVLVSACATTPPGPTVNVMPGLDTRGNPKPLALFQQDIAECRSFSAGQVDGGSSRANWIQVATAGGATLLGAGLGAAIGGGRGAAIGAGAGALGGATVGGLKSGADQDNLQKRYNSAYVQCMFTKGNR